MTKEENIEIVDTISDVLFDISSTMEVGVGAGYDHYIDIEDKDEISKTQQL